MTAHETLCSTRGTSPWPSPSYGHMPTSVQMTLTSNTRTLSVLPLPHLQAAVGGRAWGARAGKQQRDSTADERSGQCWLDGEAVWASWYRCGAMGLRGASRQLRMALAWWAMFKLGLGLLVVDWCVLAVLRSWSNRWWVIVCDFICGLTLFFYIVSDSIFLQRLKIGSIYFFLL